jgi:predicted DNA-binding transcriptional regulator YafY
VTNYVTISGGIMPKAKRLNEMIMMVNRKKRFTVQELAREFGVSKRTILRDLQELSEMGVPLYSEVGPHGGYQVLNERILPPIAFSEDEAVSIFFAINALRHYISIPFNAEYETIKKKFYLNLTGDTRDKIDRIQDRVDFVSPGQQEETPLLRELFDAAVQQNVIVIKYEKDGNISSRSIQPIGLYANAGRWYCPSYCFVTKEYRVFRCDRIKSVNPDENIKPIDMTDLNLKNRFSILDDSREAFELYVELTDKGVEQYQFSKWPNIELIKRENGSGFLTGSIPKHDIGFFADYFIGYGKKAVVQKPIELIQAIREKLNVILKQYEG